MTLTHLYQAYIKVKVFNIITMLLGQCQPHQNNKTSCLLLLLEPINTLYLWAQ